MRGNRAPILKDMDLGIGKIVISDRASVSSVAKPEKASAQDGELLPKEIICCNMATD